MVASRFGQAVSVAVVALLPLVAAAISTPQGDVVGGTAGAPPDPDCEFIDADELVLNFDALDLSLFP